MPIQAFFTRIKELLGKCNKSYFFLSDGVDDSAATPGWGKNFFTNCKVVK